MLPVLLYICKTLYTTEALNKKLYTFDKWCLRRWEWQRYYFCHWSVLAGRQRFQLWKHSSDHVRYMMIRRIAVAPVSAQSKNAHCTSSGMLPMGQKTGHQITLWAPVNKSLKDLKRPNGPSMTTWTRVMERILQLYKLWPSYSMDRQNKNSVASLCGYGHAQLSSPPGGGGAHIQTHRDRQTEKHR